jgi:hypothetical protein
LQLVRQATPSFSECHPLNGPVSEDRDLKLPVVVELVSTYVNFVSKWVEREKFFQPVVLTAGNPSIGVKRNIKKQSLH